jgi:hypothetical protein
VLAAALATAWGQPGGIEVRYDPLPPAPDLETALLQRSNAARAAAGSPPLAPAAALALAARHHALDMATQGYLGHEAPAEPVRTPALRVAAAGGLVAAVGENLYEGPGRGDVAAAAVEGWLASPGHRRNLLDPGFTHVGFGSAIRPNGQVVVVQVLAEQPLAVQGVDARLGDVTRLVATIEIDAARAAEVLIRVGDTGDRVLRVPGGRSSVHLPVPAERVTVRLGVRVDGEREFVESDGGWLDADRHRWEPLPVAARDPVRIVGVEVLPERVREVHLRVRLATPPPAPLGVWWNGSYLPGALWRDGVLELRAAWTGEVQRVDVGLATGGATYRGVLALELVEQDGRAVVRARP